PSNCPRNCLDCALKPIRMHILDFSETCYRKQMHIRTLICPVYGKTFDRFGSDQGCSFSNYGRIFSSYSEKHGITRVGYADNLPAFKVHSVPGARVRLPVSLKETFLLDLTWGPPAFLLPVCKVLKGVIPCFKVQHSPACCKRSY